MSDPLEESMGALSQYFVGDATMGETLDRVCTAALKAIPPAAFAGMSMTVDAKIGTYVATHTVVEDIDRKQYDTGDGPCLDAFRTGRVVLLHNTSEPGPYPDFRAAAVNYGIASVISLPMTANGERVGALNLYSESADAFGPAEAELGIKFAFHAAILMANAKAYWDARMLSENLTEAMRSRATIEQAKGVIMSNTRCSEDQAFDILKQQSQHENVKLRELAREIVERTQRRTQDV
jgi:GAF domain-containing protein